MGRLSPVKRIGSWFRNRPVAAVIAVLLAVSTVWIALVPVVPLSDSAAYDEHAWNLAQGYGYGWGPGQLSAFWAPGTAFIYSALYRVFGHVYLPIVLLNVALRVGIIILSMLLVREWFGKPTSLACGLLLALWPSQVQFTTVLASELPFTFLMLVGLFIWTRREFGWLHRGLLAGLVLGAAAYIRPQALVLPALFAVSAVVRDRRLLHHAAALLVSVIAMAALIAPWSMRNTELFGQRVLLSTNGGVNLWMGNNPDSGGTYVPLSQEMLETNEAVRDKILGQQAVEYILAEPMAFAGRVLRKAVILHDRETIGVHWNAPALEARFGDRVLLPLKLVSQTYWLGVLFCGLTGLVLLFRGRRLLETVTHPALLLWLYFTACHAVIVIQDRYHFPSIPLIAALAAFGLCSAVTALRRRSVSRASASLAPAVPGSTFAAGTVRLGRSA